VPLSDGRKVITARPTLGAVFHVPVQVSGLECLESSRQIPEIVEAELVKFAAVVECPGFFPNIVDPLVGD
jgi:hypothetical protein